MNKKETFDITNALTDMKSLTTNYLTYAPDLRNKIIDDLFEKHDISELSILLMKDIKYTDDRNSRIYNYKISILPAKFTLFRMLLAFGTMGKIRGLDESEQEEVRNNITQINKDKIDEIIHKYSYLMTDSSVVTNEQDYDNKFGLFMKSVTQKIGVLQLLEENRYTYPEDQYKDVNDFFNDLFIPMIGDDNITFRLYNTSDDWNMDKSNDTTLEDTGIDFKLSFEDTDDGIKITSVEVLNYNEIHKFKVDFWKNQLSTNFEGISEIKDGVMKQWGDGMGLANLKSTDEITTNTPTNTPTDTPPDSPKTSSNSSINLIIIAVAVVAVVLILVIGYIIYKKSNQQPQITTPPQIPT